MSAQTHAIPPALVRRRAPPDRPASPAVDLGREADIRLGALLVRPSRRELVVRGRRMRLEPRVMQVLVALARAKGGVVSHGELIESCWSGRIVGEDAIYRCIVQLRGLAATLEGPFCIETIARVGYRLLHARACTRDRAAPSPLFGERLAGVARWLAPLFGERRP
jgi:DNA-binding winged helix-turn-helix (wHTH) protein